MRHDDLLVTATVEAWTLTDGSDGNPPDNITFTDDESRVEIMTLTKVVDSGDSILVTGDSYITGDRETYIFPADKEIDLWMV